MSNTPRLVKLDEIRRAFTLAWLGASPPIQRSSNGGYYIRVLAKEKYSYFANTAQEKYDYFRIAGTGAIIGAPWGHAKTYRPGYMDVGELEAAIAELNPEGGSAANPARVPDHSDLGELQ